MQQALAHLSFAPAADTQKDDRCCSLIPGLDVKLSATILPRVRGSLGSRAVCLRMMGLGYVGGSISKARCCFQVFGFSCHSIEQLLHRGRLVCEED